MNVNKSITENNQKLEIISINQIDVSKTNPRTHFDENALRELSQSIKEYGILQPVLVRPTNDKEEGFEQFELVCGERRYRAAILAGLEDIPVNIRVLTDDEAFELQIVENLERKDVHPLDEADAFKKMLNSGKYTIADIAAKMAKAESFIAQRLKLVDLIEDVRADFIAGHFGIGHAILIARCDEYKQLDIYKEAKPWKETDFPNYGTVKELKETIEADSVDLEGAPFDLTDSLLNDTCACNICPKRSGANPILFSDMQDVDKCFDEKCFDEKTVAFIEKEVTKIINEGQNIVMLSGYSKPSEMIITICKQYDVQIKKEYDDWNTHERDGWDFVKGFYVSGRSAGKYSNVYLKQELDKSHQLSDTETSSTKPQMSKEDIEAKENITKIEVRQKRALELDDEKVWAEIRAIDTTCIQEDTVKLDNNDRVALALALISKISWDKQKKVREIIDITIKNIYEIEVTEEIINRLIRVFFLDVLNESYGSCKTNVKAAAFRLAVEPYFKTGVQDLEKTQREIAEKRIANANSKIEVLKGKTVKAKPLEKIEMDNEERIIKEPIVAKRLKEKK